MAPMFCTKLFNWKPKGKKDGGTRPQLDTVFPEPQDEGEACPYWTHVACNPPPPPPSRPHTPTHTTRSQPTPPPLPPHHPGSPVHHQPQPRSPATHRRAPHGRNHLPYGYNTTYNSPYHSPHQSPGPNSPVGHSPHHFTPIHHSPAHCSPARCSPVIPNQGYNSPVHVNQGYNSPVHVNQGFSSPAHQSPVHVNQGYNSPGHVTQGYNSPGHINQGYNSPGHATQGYNSPGHATQGYNSPGHVNQGYNSPVHVNQGFNSPVHQSPVHHGSGYNSPVLINQGYNSPVHPTPVHPSPVYPNQNCNNTVHHRGYVLEGNYSQPLPPPPPQRPPPPLPGTEGSQLKTVASASSSRSTSPANGSASYIPQPRSHGGRASLNEKHSKTGGTSNLVKSNLRGPATQTAHTASGNHALASPYHASPAPAKQKDSMLDKFKLFNHKEKEARNKTASKSSSGVSKRTSSSSGFSSARSERSDSSTSLCSDAKPPPLPPHQSLPVSTSSSSSDQTSHTEAQQGVAPPASKPQGLRGIRSKFSKSAAKEGKESPKSSRKEKEREEREGSRGSPRGGHKAHRDPRGESRERSAKKGEKLTLELDGGSRATRPPCPPPANAEKEIRPPAPGPRPETTGNSLGHSLEIDQPPALPPKEHALRDQSHGHYQEQTAMQQQSVVTTPGSPLPPGTPNTGIPKPTAHVKGQTKVVPPERTTPSTPTASPNVNTPHQAKDYSKMVRPAGTPSTPKIGGSGVPRQAGTPSGGDANTAQECRDPKGSLPRQKQLGRREDSATGISVAMVSPMPNPREKDMVTPSESGSNISESSQSNSGQSNSTSSGNSSVIYKPTSSEDDSVTDLKTHMRKVEEKADGEDGDEVILNIKPMQPLVRASQYGYMRGLGLHQTRTVPPSLHVSRLALQDNANTVPQKGMRIGPHLKRPPGQNQVIDTDYSDLESVDLANGYMSDGDVLRNVGYKSGNSSDLDGYLSEGGASLYAHRLNQRFKEGMRQVHESMNKVQHFIHDDRSNGTENEMEVSSLSPSTTSSEPRHFDEDDYLDREQLEDKKEGEEEEEEDDIFSDECKPRPPPREESGSRRRFDDSSSLSSGVSDTLNEMSAEDVLSSSLSSDHPAYVKQGHSMKEVGLKLPVGLSGSSSRKVAMGVDPSGVYKVVSSRAHVKKTESAQQTDNSAFKQISNTQWKKYVENGKGSLERSARDLQRGVDPSSGSSRKADHKKSNLGSPQTGVPSSPGMSGSSGVSGSASGGSRKMEKKGTSGEKRRDGERSSRDKSGVSMSAQVNGESKKIQNPKTAPSNFGYNGKRTTSTGSVSSTGSGKGSKSIKEVDSAGGSSSRHDNSSHSLERPRTKLKVSGGTQTTSDLHYMSTGVHSDSEYSSGSLGRKYQLKSYSLNGPVAAQLSQSVRERIMQSPYGKIHVGEYGQYPPAYYRERSPRIKPTDGSLSDSPYSNYAEIQYSPYSSPYSWVSRSNYAGSVASAPTRPLGGSLTEAESMESISSSASSIAAQIQHARATSLTQARLMMHQREMSSSPSPRLARSNSVSHLIERTFPRSTKSEKLYSSSVGGREGYHASQPTSPTPPGGARLPISPLNTVRGSPYYSTVIPRTSKDDECHGSSLSLVSSSSSLYSSQEEKQAAEIRKLRKELAEAQEKVGTLSSQLSTNNSVFNLKNTAHVVAAFEQSLTNMTNRLQQLTASSEQKDSEVMELRKTIEALRQQSVDAGLTVACLQSTSPGHQHHLHSPPSPARHQHTHLSPNIASCSVLNVTSGSRSSSPEKSGHDLARRHTFTGNCKDLVVCEFTETGGKLVRGTSVESVSSLSSACSAASHTSTHDKSDGSKSGKKKGWLRSSFSKAFSRGHKKPKHGAGGGSVSDVEGSAPSSPLLQRANGGTSDPECQSTTGMYSEAKEEEVEVLKKQLREKDMALTDIRLEALSSAHQLESLKETISKMRSEMVSLKQDNDRLARMVSSKSLNSSQSSLPVSDSIEQRLSLGGDEMTMPDSTDVILIDPSDKDGKRVSITVFMGCHGDYDKYVNPSDGVSFSECIIGAISVSGKTKWDMLDNLVKRIFKEYILRVDPVSNLGLSAESIFSYHIGEIARGRDADSPELLPCGYLVGEVTNIKIVLKGATLNHVDALAFETLIPKSIVQRYMSLLTEHRRIILCGPSGTGKTYLAQKLAEYLVTRMGKDPSPGYIATFNVDHKTGKDLGAYLSHISEQCESNTSDLPLVIILDNLHHAGALTDVFNGFLSAKYSHCPYIIGTMNQTTSCSTTNLQLHHNFRWVLMANHMEPVKGLVGRIARRRLTQVEVEAGSRLPRLQQVLDWLPRCWSHINKFLETHSSSDVTIGPRLFLSCPGSLEGSQVWFTDLWNYSLVPYLVEAVREGLQLYGKRATWEDPTTWITETYPWPSGNHAGPQALLSLRPEDVGYDALAPTVAPATQDKFKSDSQGENDPLLSMLMRLQEAANYSSPQQDSDTASLENIESTLESTI